MNGIKPGRATTPATSHATTSRPSDSGLRVARPGDQPLFCASTEVLADIDLTYPALQWQKSDAPVEIRGQDIDLPPPEIVEDLPSPVIVEDLPPPVIVQDLAPPPSMHASWTQTVEISPNMQQRSDYALVGVAPGVDGDNELKRIQAMHSPDQKKLRPATSSYLSAEYLRWHESQFYPPASGKRTVYSFMTRSSYEDFIKNNGYQGRQDGMYCLCRREANSLAALLRKNTRRIATEAAKRRAMRAEDPTVKFPPMPGPTNAAILAKALGFNESSLDGRSIVMVETTLSADNRVGISDGKNDGANEYWIPGGRLPTGLLEGYCKYEPISNTRVQRLTPGSEKVQTSRIAGELLMKRPGSWSLYRCTKGDLDRDIPQGEKSQPVHVLKVKVRNVIDLDLNLVVSEADLQKYLADPGLLDQYVSEVCHAPDRYIQSSHFARRDIYWDDKKEEKIAARRAGRTQDANGIVRGAAVNSASQASSV